MNFISWFPSDRIHTNLSLIGYFRFSLGRNPDKRPPAEQLLTHPFIVNGHARTQQSLQAFEPQPDAQPLDIVSTPSKSEFSTLDSTSTSEFNSWNSGSMDDIPSMISYIRRSTNSIATLSNP